MFSPYSDDDGLTYELWVCSSDAHHSTASVMEYSGRFTSVEVHIHTHTHTHTHTQDGLCANCLILHVLCII